MKRQDDGWFRMALRVARSIRWVHLISGLDEVDPEQPRCGSQTTISGYTEWLGGSHLEVTLGWDWTVDMAGVVPELRRSGGPRSNLLLTDPAGRDFDWHRNLATLARLVDALQWEGEARSAIEMRYAA